MTLQDADGLRPEELDGPAQALLQLDLRLVAEHSRAAETSAHESRMSPARGGWRFRSTGLPSMRPIVSATSFTLAGVPPATLNARPLAPRRPRPRGSSRRLTFVHVGEVARLLAVAVDRHRLAGGDRGDEERDHGRVLREGALPRAEDVEVAQHDGLEGLVDAAEGDAVALGRELRDAVGRDRVERRVLANVGSGGFARRPTMRRRRRRGARRSSRAASRTFSVPSTLTAFEVSGSWTERGTEPSAPRWKTTSVPRTALWTRS